MAVAATKNNNLFTGIPQGSKAIDVSSADALFDPPIRGFMVKVSGNVAVQFKGAPTGYGSDVWYCVAGARYEGHIDAILTAGTTATGISVLV